MAPAPQPFPGGPPGAPPDVDCAMLLARTILAVNVGLAPGDSLCSRGSHARRRASAETARSSASGGSAGWGRDGGGCDVRLSLFPDPRLPEHLRQSFSTAATPARPSASVDVPRPAEAGRRAPAAPPAPPGPARGPPAPGPARAPEVLSSEEDKDSGECTVTITIQNAGDFINPWSQSCHEVWAAPPPAAGEAGEDPPPDAPREPPRSFSGQLELARGPPAPPPGAPGRPTALPTLREEPAGEGSSAGSRATPAPGRPSGEPSREPSRRSSRFGSLFGSAETWHGRDRAWSHGRDRAWSHGSHRADEAADALRDLGISCPRQAGAAGPLAPEAAPAARERTVAVMRCVGVPAEAGRPGGFPRRGKKSRSCDRARPSLAEFLASVVAEGKGQGAAARGAAVPRPRVHPVDYTQSSLYGTTQPAAAAAPAPRDRARPHSSSDPGRPGAGARAAGPAGPAGPAAGVPEELGAWDRAVVESLATLRPYLECRRSRWIDVGGSGGAVGMVCAAVGGHVTLTAPCEAAAEQMRAMIRRNADSLGKAGGSAEVVTFDPRAPGPAARLPASCCDFGVAVACDPVASADDVAPFVALAREVLGDEPDVHLVFLHRHRSPELDAALWGAVKSAGFLELTLFRHAVGAGWGAGKQGRASVSAPTEPNRGSFSSAATAPAPAVPRGAGGGAASWAAGPGAGGRGGLACALAGAPDGPAAGSPDGSAAGSGGEARGPPPRPGAAEASLVLVRRKPCAVRAAHVTEAGYLAHCSDWSFY